MIVSELKIGTPPLEGYFDYFSSKEGHLDGQTHLSISQFNEGLLDFFADFLKLTRYAAGVYPRHLP